MIWCLGWVQLVQNKDQRLKLWNTIIKILGFVKGGKLLYQVSKFRFWNKSLIHKASWKDVWQRRLGGMLCWDGSTVDGSIRVVTIPICAFVTYDLRVVIRSCKYAVSEFGRFLFAFAKLRKATISFVMSFRLSAWNKSAPTRRIFMKFGIWVFFENKSRKFKFFF